MIFITLFTDAKPLVCDHKGTKEELMRDLKSFAAGRRPFLQHPVLIISYETLRQYSDILQSCEIGLLLCDEGASISRLFLLDVVLNDILRKVTD
jgi:SNF2 family DNA or RNA helicase